MTETERDPQSTSEQFGDRCHLKHSPERMRGFEIERRTYGGAQVNAITSAQRMRHLGECIRCAPEGSQALSEHMGTRSLFGGACSNQTRRRGRVALRSRSRTDMTEGARTPLASSTPRSPSPFNAMTPAPHSSTRSPLSVGAMHRRRDKTRKTCAGGPLTIPVDLQSRAVARGEVQTCAIAYGRAHVRARARVHCCKAGVRIEWIPALRGVRGGECVSKRRVEDKRRGVIDGEVEDGFGHACREKIMSR